MQAVQKVELIYSAEDLALLEQTRAIMLETAETITRHTLQMELGTALSQERSTIDEMWAALEWRRGVDHANSVRAHLGRVVAEYHHAIVKKAAGVLTPRLILTISTDQITPPTSSTTP